MRIHHLRVQAFGPFAGEVEVDLDSLSDAGLFLLTGATGAGKTSVLDAICFALYGAVPGDRQTAKRLRSDQAAEGVPPEVTLELTVEGRRFRIDRSPAWERPKKRGSGSTTQQPSVLVEERVDGAWRPLATRLDDAGHLVTGLLGMNLTQFCQVQLLPQGRFQAFLRAGSDERHRLLQQLFRTSRFEEVEGWLRDRRRSLRRESGDHEQRIAELVNRVSETSGRPVPEWSGSEVTAWATTLTREAADAVLGTRDAVAAAAAVETTARADLDAGRTLQARRERWARASAEQAELARAEPDHHARESRLDAGQRAARVLPLGDAAAAASTAHARSVADADESRARAARLIDVPEILVSDLAHFEERARAGAARARAHEPRVVERDLLAERLDRDQSRLATLDRSFTEAEERLASLPATVSRLRAEEAEALAAVDGAAAARTAMLELVEQLRSARRVVALEAERAEAEVMLRSTVDSQQELREQWLDLQERRLNGMAAEIAVGLAVGCSCPVCGSADHPHPASSPPGSPDAEAVREARRRVDDAEIERHARSLGVAELDSALAVARARAAGADPTELAQRLSVQKASAARLTQLADDAPAVTEARVAAEAEHADLATRAATLGSQRSALMAGLEERQAQLDAVDRELRYLLSGSGLETVGALADHLEVVAEACREAWAAHAACDRAAEEAMSARDRAEHAARSQGFLSYDAVTTAAAAAGDLTELAADVRRHQTRVAAVSALLADPDLVTVAATETPDLPSLEEAHARAEATLRDASDTAASTLRRAERLARLRGDLVTALDAWAPVREQLELVDRMATLADGTSPDNRLRMRLSGYVLAFRLRQVVAAANERLVVMTESRYRLEHSGDRGAGETRGGLSLRVRDDWSGEARDPVTLSGGETFVVSLALALGLADVIAHEAGGSELDTLFVDEGFGTLDADSLDHVMDMLDSLRDGGRVVGVVSHVAELRDRIPAQLHVQKRREGSTVHQDATSPLVG